MGWDTTTPRQPQQEFNPLNYVYWKIFLICVSLLSKRLSSFALVISSYWEDRKSPNKFGTTISTLLFHIIFILTVCQSHYSSKME